MANGLKRSPGLPIYLDHPGCEGSGYVLEPHDDRKCNCGKFYVKVDCPAPDCLDGTWLCSECISAGRTVRVLQQGPDYFIPMGAVRMDGDEPLCAFHYNLLEEEPAPAVMVGRAR